jgi:hypothetical protein
MGATKFYGTEGREFESLRARYIALQMEGFLFGEKLSSTFFSQVFLPGWLAPRAAPAIVNALAGGRPA